MSYSFRNFYTLTARPPNPLPIRPAPMLMHPNLYVSPTECVRVRPEPTKPPISPTNNYKPGFGDYDPDFDSDEISSLIFMVHMGALGVLIGYLVGLS